MICMIYIMIRLSGVWNCFRFGNTLDAGQAKGNPHFSSYFQKQPRSHSSSPFWTCDTPQISGWPHPEGESCTYYGMICTISCYFLQVRGVLELIQTPIFGIDNSNYTDFGIIDVASQRGKKELKSSRENKARHKPYWGGGRRACYVTPDLSYD